MGVRLKIIFECCEIKKSKRQKDETTKSQKTKKDWRAMKKYLSDLFAHWWWMVDAEVSGLKKEMRRSLA